MEKVAQYMCLQHDSKYVGQSLYCTMESCSECIGISGYSLNYLLCGFLNNHQPSDNQVQYQINWRCEDGVLFPTVFRQVDSCIQQYIGTKQKEPNPAYLKYDTIGRTQCLKPLLQDQLCLELESHEANELEEKIIKLEFHFQDYFVSPSSSAYPAHPVHQDQLLLMSLIIGIRSGDWTAEKCAARNCLLLLLAHQITLPSLAEYVCRVSDQKTLATVLDFLKKYCDFATSLLLLCEDRNMSPSNFQQHFKDHWRLDLNELLTKNVLTGRPEKAGGTGESLVVVPRNPFLTVPQFQDSICRGIHFASYPQQYGQMDRIRKVLLSRCTSSGADDGLKSIETYIQKMEQLRQKKRAGTRQAS